MFNKIFFSLDIYKFDRMVNHQLIKMIFLAFALLELVRSHGYLSEPRARNGGNNGLYCGGNAIMLKLISWKMFWKV